MKYDQNLSGYLQEQDDYDAPPDVDELTRDLTAALVRIEDLEAERDELLDVCRSVLSKLDYLQNLWGQEGITRGVADRLRAAVNNATPS